MPDIQEPITHCLKCGEEVWDNRASKKNPKSPDFKCKDKDGCGEGYWLPGGAANARSVPKTKATGPRPVPQGYADTDAQEAAEVARIQAAAAGASPKASVFGPVYTFEQLQTNMAGCFKFAVELFDEAGVPPDPRAIAQITDTLFIERQRRGA